MLQGNNLRGDLVFAIFELDLQLKCVAQLKITDNRELRRCLFVKRMMRGFVLSLFYQ